MQARDTTLVAALVALGLLGLLLLPPASAQDPAPLLPPAKPGQLVPNGFGTLDPLPGDAERGAMYGFDTPRDKPTKPDTHRHNFLKRHGALARADDTPCLSCHTRETCLDCHAGALRPGQIHPPGYIAFHSIEANRTPGDCASCHTAATFCKDCHDSVRAGTRKAAPRVGLRFHPASWLGEVAGPEHGDAARRNLTACTSCHTERDCVTCHTGINPHPPGWRADCARLAASNPRACVLCHQDLRRLAALCR